MANLILTNMYGANITEYMNYIPGISMQFHITAKCDQKCKHCYMYDSPFYKNQIENPLTKGQIFQLLDEYFAFNKKLNAKGGLAISGGDPILSPYFWDILEYIKTNYASDSDVRILGNPYHITTETAKLMKNLGVKAYQVSIDGLRDMHDFLRKPGSFDDSLRALQVLKNEGILTIVSFTLSKLNCSDFIPLYNLLDGLSYVDSFIFNRLVPTGNGKKLKDSVFSAEEYRKLLFDIYREIISKKRRLLITMNEKLWKPLLFDLGLSDPLPNVNKCVSGCMCGTEVTSILADGTMFPCRRMEKAAGKFPEKSFKDLYINNNITNDFRNYESYKGCNKCELFYFCRGCPAIKYAATGDFFHSDPNCWRCKDED